ncbi:hypothetical protein E2A64_11965 [Pseudohoeflea suaedae]|uniref:Glycosyltransferase RgtA/B/C/D-like domain-containing protein n=1 Tax=Pseudohoeflea suaedae TaxID=877384 RepID=A0A4R5PJY6_9HYPH|nr:hypothetical protein [Pseudohoeflea suaedae]TDH36011.1 hypothetical protein E2A64_11965 [Pseudohoeflea suaedae]
MADIYYGAYGAGTGRQRPPYVAYVVLLAFLAAAAVMQFLPLVLPIGPMYWDVLVYYDAIGRMNAGQWPVTDFQVPVGPLEYWLTWVNYQLFPDANPILLTQLQWLPITAPVMALILWDASKRSSWAVWGLLLAWVFYTALPFNDTIYNNFAGSDGYGIYNRHGSHLMFLTAATVLFVRSRHLQTALFSVLLVSLALCKITAFAAVGPLLILGLLTRRIHPYVAVATALVCIGFTGVLQLATGVISGYIGNILLLAQENSGTLLPRFLTAMSMRIDVLLPGAILCLVLFWREVISFRRPRDREQRGVIGLLDGDWVWIGLSLFCGLVFETQNTGSHPYFVAWPAILRMMLRPADVFGSARFLIYVVTAFVVVPAVSTIAYKAVRLTALAPTYIHLDEPVLGPIGRVSVKDVYAEQAERMRSFYIKHPEEMIEIAESGALPSFRLFVEHDYQFLLIQEMGRAATAIGKLEASTGEHFRSVLDLDFANPFPFILRRPGTEYVMIGADPSRSIPTPDQKTLRAIAETDLILSPKCPFQRARYEIRELFYKPALADRVTAPLTPCYDVLLKPGSPFLKVLSPSAS